MLAHVQAVQEDKYLRPTAQEYSIAHLSFWFHRLLQSKTVRFGRAIIPPRRRMVPLSSNGEHWVSLPLGTMDHIVRLRVWITVSIPDLVVRPSRPVVFRVLMKQNKQKQKEYATHDRPKTLSVQSQVLNSISVLSHINIDGNRIVGWAERPPDVETYICANGPAVRAIS